jgi:hypothetical protein
MEKFGSQQFRSELAKKIRGALKEGRKEILEKAKASPEYWQARTEKIKERQNEEEIDNGLGILVKNKTLYHGSGISGIKSFNKAEEHTVGSGVYLTSEAKDAIGYAYRRSRREKEASPVIYECSVRNVKLLDLRKDENVKKILDGFKQILIDELKKPDLKWYVRESFQRALDAINSGKVGSGNLREVTFSMGQMFSDYCQSLGYDGLIIFEGGERNDIGIHDTYLIFDPEKVKIIQEHKIL